MNALVIVAMGLIRIFFGGRQDKIRLEVHHVHSLCYRTKVKCEMEKVLFGCSKEKQDFFRKNNKN